MPREKKNDRLDERMVTLVPMRLKKEYTEMCDAIGENVSEHIRTNWDNEVALWKANKA